MTSPETISIGIEELLGQAKRLGLTPVYRQGTVLGTTTPGLSSVMVTLDNDDAPSRCYNFMGQLDAGDRVLVLVVKPQGLYVLGQGTPVRRKYQLTFLDSAACTSLLALTTTQTDVTGCVLTATTLVADAKWEVTAFFDAQILGANNNTARGYLQVDGVDEASTALYSANFVSSNNRATIGQVWEGVLATPGDHVFQLQGDVTAGSGQWRFNVMHTKLSLKVFE